MLLNVVKYKFHIHYNFPCVKTMFMGKVNTQKHSEFLRDVVVIAGPPPSNFFRDFFIIFFKIKIFGIININFS